MLCLLPSLTNTCPVSENKLEDQNDDDEEERDCQQGMQFLLGGLSIQDVTVDAWDNESCPSCDDTNDNDSIFPNHRETKNNTGSNETEIIVPKNDSFCPTHPTSSNNDMTATPQEQQLSRVKSYDTYKLLLPENQDVVSSSSSSPNELEIMFQYAYNCLGYCTAQGRMERPPVQPVQFLVGNRGKGLIATRSIGTGATIYTERAAVATQLPNDPVRACQNCFRSMEPASSVVPDDSTPANTTTNTAELPMRHLWPVPEFDFSSSSTAAASLPSSVSSGQSVKKYRVDKWKRIHCIACNSWFCNHHCLSSLENEVGDHCSCRRALELLKPRKNDTTNHESNRENYGEFTDETDYVVQAPVALATRIFAMAVHHHRTHPQRSLEEHCFWIGLCGSATDLTSLELGFRAATTENPRISTTYCENDNDSSDIESNRPSPSFYYTLEPLYQKLLHLFALTEEEQTILTLALLERLASMAARNGFGYRTQSPFTSYYNALLRQEAGGCRGTPKHEALKAQVATALGSTTGTLERGMDQQVEACTVPQLVAIFPLTARINHSCHTTTTAECQNKLDSNNIHDNGKTHSPPPTTTTPQYSSAFDDDFVNAQVQNQVFMDCHMDLVATRDIAVGQEILISYLGPMSSRNQTKVARRQRELKAKYLFDCTCSKCRADTVAG